MAATSAAVRNSGIFMSIDTLASTEFGREGKN